MANSGSGSGARGGKAEALLSDCRSRLRQRLRTWTEPSFAQASEYLFRRAEKAGSTEQQNRTLAAVNALKKRREDFARALDGAIAQSFHEGLAVRLAPSDREAPGELALVEESELEQSLAVSDMVSKAELRFSQELYALNQRISVLNRGRELTNETNPLAPAKLARAIRYASRALQTEPDYQVVLLRAFDRVLMASLGDFYREINELLIGAGILPNIKFEAPSRGADGEPKADAPDTEGQDAEQRRRESRTDSASSRAAGRSGESSAQLTEELYAESAALLSQLRDLMDRVGRHRATASAERPAAEPAQIDAALEHIQGEVAADGRGGGLEADAIRKRLDHWLAQHERGIGAEQARTVELMGLIYHHLREEMHTRPVHGLLEQLQIPMLRVALADEHFLEDRDHPARQLFDSIAAAGDLWMDDRPEDSPTFQKLDQAVATILAEYRGDAGIFRQLLEDLQKHIALLSRKAQVAEKRHVQACKGKERLHMARAAAAGEIEKLVSHYRPPEFGRSLLQGAWSDYLSLLHLREGDDSESWRRALATARYLAVSLQGRIPANMAAQLRQKLDPVKEELQRGLAQVGYGAQDIEGVLRRVGEGVAWAASDRNSDLPQPADIQRPAPVMHEAIEAEERSTQPQPPDQALSTAEKQQLARLRLTPFGTWFEIRFEEGGPWLKRKLSWYSPVSGHCLFVDNQGHPEEMELARMARLLSAGLARHFEISKKPLLDRALGAVFQKLKKMAGGTEAADA